MTAAQVERELPSSPNIKHIDLIKPKELALMTGGKPTGRDLDLYGDDLYLEYPNATIKYAVEDEFDEGPRPLLFIGTASISLEASYVIEDPNRTRIVQASDTSETGSVYLQVVTFREGGPTCTITPASIEAIKFLYDKDIAEAALLSWVAGRRILEKEAVKDLDFYLRNDIRDERFTKSHSQKVDAEMLAREAETTFMSWFHEKPLESTI